MYIEDVCEARNSIEKALTTRIMIKNTKIYQIYRNALGEIVSFSPYAADNQTGLSISNFVRYKYSHLSVNIHSLDDRRSELLKEMDKIIPVTNYRYVHLVFKDLEDRQNLVRHCNKNRIAIPNKEQINKFFDLIREWREESKKCHYRLTKQEKRKLKKLARVTLEKELYQN